MPERECTTHPCYPGSEILFVGVTPGVGSEERSKAAPEFAEDAEVGIVLYEFEIEGGVSTQVPSARIEPEVIPMQAAKPPRGFMKH